MSAQGHGHTVAAWTAVAIILAAFLIAAIGLMVGSMTTFVAGVVLAPIGGLVGKLLQLLGFGQAPRR